MKTDIVTVLSNKYHTLLDKYGINTTLRKAHFFGQLYHESKCIPISENLNYSKERLLKIFPKYFPTLEIASKYANKPKEIASKVYGGRMGNGIENTNDGWKYRGRGFLQITGKDNYRILSEDTGIDFLNNPDLLLEEANSMIAALWFFRKNNLNKYADKDDCLSITKKINGGIIGLTERKRNVKILKEIF